MNKFDDRDLQTETQRHVVLQHDTRLIYIYLLLCGYERSAGYSATQNLNVFCNPIAE